MAQAATVIQWQDFVCIILASVISSLASELINWFLIYRHDDYKKLVNDLANTQVELEKVQGKVAFTGGQGKQKMMKRKEEQLD